MFSKYQIVTSKCARHY